MAGAWVFNFAGALLLALVPAAVSETERAGQTTALPSLGQDPIFTGSAARYVVTVEAAGARCAVPADFDADGDLDIVSVSSNDNTVAWYERLSDGSYGPKRMISRASNGARIVTVGDIDQDNRTDVIVASYYDHTVGWFRNLGGSFGSMNMISRTAISAQGVSVADLDNDGDLDVLSASSGDNTVAWYENLGGGKFCEVKNVVDTNSIGVRTVVAADLDEDGFLDLAVASKDDNSITWYRNDQQSNFQKIVIDNQARGAYSLVATDVDQDGHLDLVTAANMDGFLPDNGEGGKVSLYLNRFGAGGQLCNFSKVAVTAGNATGQNDFDWFVLSVWAGDLDADGDVDIASASFSLLHQGGISWYENADGAGQTWIRHQIYQTPSAKTGHYVFGADMDGDGDNDLLAVTNGDNKVQILTAKTACDDSLTNPRAACCTKDQFWDGSACASCHRGTFLHRQSGASSCKPCSTACPRRGLFFQPATCHSVASCGDEAQSFARCDCGVNKYLDTSTGVCAACPDGHITLGDRTRTAADFSMAQRNFLDQTSYRISDLSWQGFHSNRCQVPSCSPGAYFNLTRGSCLLCTPGSFSIGGGVTRCEPCPEGSSCTAGTANPSPCQAGNYSGVGAEVCSVSPAGYVTAIAGMARPQACEPGTVAAMPGMVRCTACLVGSFAESAGQSACISCGAGYARPSLWTSMKPILRNGRVVWAYTDAASSPIANGTLGQGGCTCDVGARAAAGGECVPCEEGLHCKGGPGKPSMLPGFHADTRENMPPEAFVGVAGEYSVFRCLEDAWCPGGQIGACREGRVGIGCSECEAGMVSGNGGACRPCTEGDFAIFSLFCVAFFLALVAIYYLISQGGQTNHSLSAVLILVISSLIMAVLQKIGVFSSLSIAWVTPIQEIVEFLSVVNLSLQLLRFGCLGKFSSTARYMATLSPVLAMLLMTFAFHYFTVLFRYDGRFKERRPALIHTLGTIIMFFLIAIVHIVVAPFHCVPNPNGLQVMHEYPSVICGESSEHSTMIGLAVVWCLLPLGFTAMVCRVVYEFPRRMAMGDAKFFRSFYFMVFRFRPEAFWYLAVFTFRSLLIPLVPIIPHKILQILLMVSMIAVVAWIQCRYFPWRVQLANYLDSVMMMILIVFLCALGFLVQDREENSTMVAYLCSVLLIASLTAGLVVLIAALARHTYSKKRKLFQYFICHHKKDAAAQARLLKILLQMGNTSCNVFIDSDNLENLDILLDTVRCDVEHLIVYLTKDTLTRCWCAGEITTAVESGIRMTRIVCPCWSAPINSQLENLNSFIDLSDTNLMQLGITFDMVKKAYAKLLDVSTVTVPLSTDARGVTKFEHIVSNIISKNWNSVSEPDLQPGMVVISSPTDSDDNETLAASMILMKKINRHILQFCPNGICMLANFDPRERAQNMEKVQEATALLVVLGSSSLSSAQQLEDIVNGIIYLDCVIPVILPSFTFPGRNYYTNTLPQVWHGDVESAQTALEEFFHRIGIPFSTSASDEILSQQSRSVVDRIQGGVGSRVSGRMSGRGSTESKSAKTRSSRRTSNQSPGGVGAQESFNSSASGEQSGELRALEPPGTPPPSEPPRSGPFTPMKPGLLYRQAL